MIKALVRRLVRADRPKVIAVLCPTHEEALSCVRHARTSGSELPIWVWCAEAADEGSSYADRVRVSANPWIALRELNGVWPALIIVSWSGQRVATGLKLLPLLLPPFRVVIRNEANGFFSAGSLTLFGHVGRRMKDGVVSGLTRLSDWAAGAGLRITVTAQQIGDWLGSAILAALATVAPLVWPLAHAVARKRRRARAVSVHVGEAVDTSAAEIVVSDRRWRRSRILHALKTERVSFLVFRHPACTEPAQPLLDLAHRTGAFVVAQQAAYTGWRPQVTNRHPFRPLQPGEKSPVLSPVSPLFVVRRDAVERLGVPRAVTFGAGMASLCHRAAAAGLESFALGGTQPLTQERSMALEDVELVLRLHDFVPRIPELRRGNIARSAAGGPGLRGRPLVLVVSPYLPFPLSHGGAVRIYNLCRELSDEVDYILACFREVNERVFYPELHNVFREVHVVDIDEREVDSTVPQQVAEYRNSAMRALIRSFCRERNIELVQLEYTQMAEYRDCAGDTPVLLVEHDITFSLYEQLAQKSRTESGYRQFRLWQRFEREALADVAAVWTMSSSDRALAVENGAPPEATGVVPNGVDLQRFRPAMKSGSKPVVLFVGSFRHLPNLLAFEVLRDRILPEVRKVVPQVQLHVVAGPEHERAARLAGKAALLEPVEGICIDGFVEDLRPAYQECDVVAIPLPVSAGTNIKLMEAMACGRAVVSTPLGCYGLGLVDGEDLLVRDLEEGFAEALITLLEDSQERAQIARRARVTAEKTFGWERIARGAKASYAQLLGTACCEPIH